MAFDNKSIRPILENEELSIKDKVNQLQTLHHEIVNGLMDEKDEAIQRAEKTEKAAESAKAEKKPPRSPDRLQGPADSSSQQGGQDRCI